MITDAEGNLADAIRLEDKASKGSSGGVVYMSKRLRAAISALADSAENREFVITNQRGEAMSAQVVTNWFFLLYRSSGFEGCSSHSGRRTAITRWSRKISSVGSSLRDVQALARHGSLAMTQRYIEISADWGRAFTVRLSVRAPRPCWCFPVGRGPFCGARARVRTVARRAR